MGPLRRLRPALPPLRLRDADAGRGRLRLADLLRGPEAALRALRARTPGGRGRLAVGRSAPLPARAAPDLRRRRARVARCARGGDRDEGRPGRDHERRDGQPPALHLPRLLPAGLQGEREGQPARHPRPGRDRAGRRDPQRLDGHPDRARRVERPRHRRPLRRDDDRRRALPAGGSGLRRRLLDRVAPTPAHLDERPLPERARELERRRRALPDGAGRAAGRRPLPRAAADVQGAAAGGLVRAVLRDGRVARVRARVIDPDGQPAADRLGGARARGRAPRCCAPGVHARLQPLGCPRRALGAAAAGGEPGDARRRARPVRDADLALRLHAVRERPRQHRLCEEDDAGALAGGGSTGRAVDRPVRPPRRRLPDGRLARRLGGRRRPPGVGGAEPVRLRRQRHADPGIREPGADDHGARLASGAAPGREAAGRLEGAGGSGALMQPGFPLWLVVTHFLNILFLTLLARSGLEILSAFPKLYLSDHCPPGRELVRFTRRTFRPESPPTWTSLDEEESWSPVIALPGRKNLGLARHWHFMTIQFWILTGLVYVALLFVDAQWRRLVPTSWSI